MNLTLNANICFRIIWLEVMKEIYLNSHFPAKKVTQKNSLKSLWAQLCSKTPLSIQIKRPYVVKDKFANALSELAVKKGSWRKGVASNFCYIGHAIQFIFKLRGRSAVSIKLCRGVNMQPLIHPFLAVNWSWVLMLSSLNVWTRLYCTQLCLHLMFALKFIIRSFNILVTKIKKKRI